MSTRCFAFAFFLLFANATAFDALTMSMCIKNMARAYRCRCVNLISDYQFLMASRVVSKILSLSFHSCRVLSVEEYKHKGPSDCLTSLNVLFGDDDFRQMTFLDNRREKWLLFVKSSANAGELFHGVDVSFDSAVTLAKPLPNSSHLFTLEYVYRVRKDLPLRVQLIDTMDVGERATRFYPMPKRMDLERIDFKAGCNSAIPTTFQRKVVTEEGKTIKIDGGYIFDVFKTLSESLNFQFTVTWYNEPMGTLLHGKWTGLAKLLNEKEIDVLLGTFNMSPSRLNLADFPGTLLVSRFQIYSRPFRATSTLRTLLRPLTGEVWMLVALWLFVVSMTLFMNLTIRQRFDLINAPMPTNIAESVYFTTQALCQQAYSFVPKGLSLRVIIFIAYLTANTLVPSYSASLISSLTQRQILSPFSSLSELRRRGFKLLVGEDSEDYSMLMGSLDPTVQSLADGGTIIPIKYAENTQVEEAYRKVLMELCKNHTKLSLFGDEIYLDYAIKQKEMSRCRLVKMDPLQPLLHQSFAFKKDTPYNDIFRLRILQFREYGILSKITKQYWLEHNQGERKFSYVDIADVAPIFNVFGVGMIIAFVLFLIEKCSYNKSPISHDAQQRHTKRFDYYNKLVLT